MVVRPLLVWAVGVCLTFEVRVGAELGEWWDGVDDWENGEIRTGR